MQINTYYTWARTLSIAYLNNRQEIDKALTNPRRRIRNTRTLFDPPYNVGALLRLGTLNVLLHTDTFLNLTRRSQTTINTFRKMTQ